jgi:uncharacterized membrane protein YqjE
MKFSPDKAAAAPAEAPVRHPTPCPDWRTALMTLIAARVALIEMESKDLAQDLSRRLLWLILAVGCSVFAWLLILAGGISLASDASGLSWNKLAIGTALLHLVAAILFTRLAKPTSRRAYPFTRAEFSKDREWIENFQKIKKSND